MSSLIGQSLGRYQVLEQLGEGGMATVYKAFDTTLERFVALKVIRTDQFAPAMLAEIMKRFEREAKALAKLSHPNIVHVHDYGEYAGAPYLVMEYLPSGTLKNESDVPMPWQQALHILVPIAHALAYAHEHNIIHRDIKPANILLTEKGLPMLSDFGIAKILEENKPDTLTGAGMTIGTPEYMAPEQWTGQSTPQSDIYSLGIVLYELVTGRKPFEADTPMAVMLKQVNDPLPHPRQFVPDLPQGLETVLLKALERQPENRYRSMSDFAAALEQLTTGQTLGALNNADAALAGRTMLASGEPGREQGISPMSTGTKNETVIRSTPGINNSPEKTPQPASKKSRRWVPVTVLVVLLCLGGVIAATLSIRSLAGSSLLSGLINNPTASNNGSSPTQAITQSLNDPLALVPTPSLSVPLPTPGTQVKVLWDVSRGPWTSTDGTSFSPDGMYKSLVQVLTSENIVISSGDLTNLNSYDILVLSAASMKMPYTSTEVDKIEQFVRVSGHGLLIMSDTPEYENLADVVSRRFSISLGELTSAGPVSNANEPFFSGVNSLQFINGGGVFQVSSPAQTASVDKNGNSVIAFCNCDTGRVMAVSDANLWDNTGIIQADNQRFAINVFLWLAKISP